jgi:peptide/nickel transport system substrate-binding protein
MRHFGWQWLAASSLLLAALTANAATRPGYGGTLRIEMRAAPASLDPADVSVPDSAGRRNLTALIFDTLVAVNDDGQVKAGLAESWRADGNQQWRFRVRRNVRFHDGSLLTSESVAASLRLANPLWNVTADADSVIVRSDVAERELLAELARPRNAIVKRDSGKLSGTGAFQIGEWQAGKTLMLVADENCWRGRPFLDEIEVQLGRSYRDQMTALQLGRADLIEVSPEQTRRVSQESRRVASSRPIELVALVFARDAGSTDDKSLRTALGLSADRASMRDVLLQGAGEPTGSILPTWMSGYGFVFSPGADIAKARQLRSQIAKAPGWKLGYAADDPLERLLAERIALNGRDAGLQIQTTPSSGADLKIARIPLELDPWAALDYIMEQVGAPLLKKSGSLEDLYADEKALLANGRIIPLLHLPVSYEVAPNLQSGKVRADGVLTLDNAWLESRQP